MRRKLAVIFMSLVLCWTTFACGSASTTQSGQNQTVASNSQQVTQGEYAVQQATYNDANGEYTVMLLNTPSGKSSVYRTTDLQMARLTDEEIKGGKKTYLDVEGNSAAMHLTEDFKIEYVHNVTETRTDPQTGQTETVVVRRESNFWTPFAGALVGQAVGNALFAPRYYVPPVYQSGVVLSGYGGYGNSYSQAVSSYQNRYQSPPPAVKNRQVLRTTGNLRKPSSSTSTTTRTTQPNNTRSSGSGVGSSDLGSSGSSTTKPKKSNSGFGSSRKSSPSRSRRR
ncbi:MAG: hypothetical protein SAJ37_23590 [Oscillatoria sp. PMC 1068.18]|nr:hypothetical protein [Oscillatoria sp. PMC 1076.18]MEC4991730.1 hypothetical protein [Oscillatoria sp. PMC 1068.18]